MSLQHRKDSVRELRLKQQGITPPKDWNNVEQVRDVVTVSYTHLTLPTNSLV